MIKKKNNGFPFPAVSIFLAGVWSINVFAVPAPELIKSLPQSAGGKLIYASGFETAQSPELRLLKGFRHAPGEGVNGNAAIRVDREGDAAKASHEGLIDLPAKLFHPNENYVFTVDFKVKDLKCVRKPSTHFVLCAVKFLAADRKKVSECLEVIPPPTNTEYLRYKLNFKMPENISIVELSLQLRHMYNGTIWYDNAAIHSAGYSSVALMTQPEKRNFNIGGGNFNIVVHSPGRDSEIYALVEFEQDGKTVKSQVYPVKDGCVSGQYGNLKEGGIKVKVWTADMKNKCRLNYSEFNGTVRKALPAPANAVFTDSFGRTVVDGRPFMPIGCFVTPADIEDQHAIYKAMSEIGFNCVLDYHSIALSSAKLASSKSFSAKRILSGLDEFAKYNLRSIFCLYHLTQPSKRLKNFEGRRITDYHQELKNLINALKGHPSILAWYLTDEMCEADVELVEKYRESINRLDPLHPTITLTNLPSALPNYARSGDYFLFDSYPLEKAERGDNIEGIISFAAAAKKAGVPVWMAPQAFNWGLIKQWEVKDAAGYRKYIEPTADMLRSMSYLGAIHDARAFIFYSFPSARRYAEVIRKVDDPQYYPRTVKMLSEVIGGLKKAEPYIMGSKTPPELTLSTRGDIRVEARAFRADNGKVGVLIVGCGGKPNQGGSEAVISVPGCDNLQSAFGHTRNLGGGLYHYRAPRLSSDLLVEQ